MEVIKHSVAIDLPVYPGAKPILQRGGRIFRGRESNPLSGVIAKFDLMEKQRKNV